MIRGSLIAVFALALFASGASGQQARSGRVLFSDTFPRANGANSLITNEYAFRNPTDKLAVQSPKWETTSGSLFFKRGVGWTGVPDGCKPDRYSQTCNDSAVFRLHTRRLDFKSVKVSLRLLVHSLTTTTRTPARNIDGVHVWLRYQSEAQLYVASVNRRDGQVVIKKKCPGGPSNGGTYYDLAKPVKGQPIPLGKWQAITVTIRDNADGSVAVAFARDGVQIASATDAGLGCPAIKAAGAVGVRGDNTDFSIENFTVSSL